MPHVLGLLLSLCSTHCPAPLPMDALQLTLIPARLELCLLRLPLKQVSCVAMSTPWEWTLVRHLEQRWQRLVALSASGARVTR
ncbi:hypothetical protein E1J23_07105 [Xanthomonas gardneri]|uniref:Uncharacterized protein n=2 Tax=Xanthomonas hortorum TaxID=56454 RepID=A0A6V7E1E3_9XANT|nr:hypothetical protein [Xanthomonas hortorum]MCC4622877.1 hypothetical protein [Xanthomonas campestris pv. nigromaculans]APP79999.1 hypothetical protein BJD10_10065 [Xanthomonas hortorum pv. gardneri]KLA94842.1 hypothetical protein SM19410_16495 [Xanthomonas hortorum pv. gardneri]KLA95471.1 hypothetical protein SM17710_17355 [Xanthomonas hortorum pv. gardneri]KLB05661.1 hypothetical protein SM18210_02930 [Xanthomonas hortorum pv. gardneri]